MKRLTLLISAGLIVINISLLQADTIHVPADSLTIQAGINGAVDGDTVLVADGIYTGDGNRDIDFLGKAIVVMSENGPENCIIDCEEGGRGFYFHRSEDSTSILQGLTITNGNVQSTFGGGGIYCYDSSPTITGNTIEENAGGYGGGIDCRNNSSPTITGNRIIGNKSTGVNGGAGGGIFCVDSSPTITYNTIKGNEAASGGGIACDIFTSPIIKANTIMRNTAFYAGRGEGGGIKLLFCSPIIIGNTISENFCGSGGGGGINCEISSPIIAGNTISRNTSLGGGGGIDCGDCSTTITNSILWGNQPDEIYVYYGDPVITYSDIQSGYPGEGNIDEDPMFVLADKSDYRLLWESPCIDTGHPDHFDPDGTRSDMGDHYFNQNDYLTLYVTPDTTEIPPETQLGVTYTIINRWEQPELCWYLTQVIQPSNDTLTVLGPNKFTVPAWSQMGNNCYNCHSGKGYTARFYKVHEIPFFVQVGEYEYWSRIGVPPRTLYDEDNFKFWIVE